MLSLLGGYYLKREIEIDRFPVKTDNGKQYIIVQYQEYIPNGSFDNPQSETAALKSFFTSTGLLVNRIDSETFQIVETNEIVRKV